jgi:hypothetical protein
MFAASLQLTLDYDALIETDSHNDDQQEHKNDSQRFIETAREVAKPLMKGRCKGP